jgi:hypothetical protein
MSGVVVQETLYTLGDFDVSNLNSIQQLCLERLVWRDFPLRLPQPGRLIPAFKVEEQVYFVLERTLDSLLPLRRVKFVSQCNDNSWHNHYNRGTLYSSNCDGAVTAISLTP